MPTQWKFPKAQVAGLITTYLQQCIYVPVQQTMMLTAIEMMNKYDFQLFDAIIVAAALDTDCSIFYSEDMKDGQFIEQQLQIVNPFKTIVPAP